MKSFLLAWILFGASFVSAAGWIHDYEDALEKAQKSHKRIMMMYVKKT